MKFILKILNFILVLFGSFAILAYIFSQKHNMPFDETITYFKNIGMEILNIDTSKNISVNSDISPDNLIINTSTNKSFYYEQLDETSKIIYNEFEKNINNLKKDNYVIDFSTMFNDLLNTSNRSIQVK